MKNRRYILCLSLILLLVGCENIDFLNSADSEPEIVVPIESIPPVKPTATPTATPKGSTGTIQRSNTYKSNTYKSSTPSKSTTPKSSTSKSTTSKSSSSKKTYKSSSKTTYHDSYDDGYNDIYEEDDYDWDRYWKDDDYASGVDDALEDYEEYGEDW